MTRRPEPHSRIASDSAALSLDRFLRSGTCITYHENIPDREFPKVKCSVYGAPKTNELFVKLSNGKVSFVAATPSLLVFPVMADRVFGMDESDQDVAFGLAERLWEENRAQLLPS